MLILQGAVLGLGATILMDIWQQILGRLPGQTLPNWAPAGRWFRHLPSGVVFHDDIARAEPYAHELALGWAAHYAVGILYGVIFALIVGQGWMADPRLLPAWLFGLAVIAAGWFLLQPGMGLGWAGSRTPNPAKVRLLGIVAHSIFGIGLYLTARLVL
jgi:hypothetical protein